MKKVLLLALVGAACGIIPGGIYRLLVWYIAMKTPSDTDDDLVLFAKLLRMNKGKVRAGTIMRMTDQSQFRGSVGGQTATHTFLMGWYQIAGATAGPLKDKIQKLIDRGAYPKAMKMAERKGLHVERRDFLFQTPRDGEEGQLAVMRMAKPTDQTNGRLEITTQDIPDPHHPKPHPLQFA